MTFQRSCLYHPTDGMIVIEAHQQAEYKRLIDTGVWFDHPNKAKEMRNYHEEQIRQRPRQRRGNAKHETKTI